MRPRSRALLFLLLCLLLPVPSWAGFTDYDNSVGTSDGSATTIANSSLAVTAGDFVICGVTWEGTNSDIASISDLTSSTWVKGTAKANSGSNGEPHTQLVWTLAGAAFKQPVAGTTKATSGLQMGVGQ